MEKISAALRRLDLSEFEQTIYLSLLRTGRATARMLADRTGITRPSVYDQLKSLLALNLVVELEVEGKAYFAAADIKHLDALLSDRIDRLEQSREFLAEALPTLIDSLDTVTPKIRFFEGTEGVKQLLKDIMWHDNATLYITWAVTEMSEVFDAAFLEWFDARRLTRHLQAEVLWSEIAQANQSNFFTAGPKDKSRQLPKNLTTSMSSIIYPGKVAYISSSAEAFGFIVESKEFSLLQSLQFVQLWQISKASTT